MIFLVKSLQSFVASYTGLLILKILPQYVMLNILLGY